jgi:hypothetical protein
MKTGTKHTDESRARIAAAKRGRSSGFAGKTHTRRTRRQIARSVTLHWALKERDAEG